MRATPLADVLEADFQRQIEQLAKTLGWKLWHCYNSRRSDFGWPDLALCRDRLLLIEVKREAGKLTEPQKAWLRSLLNAGQEAYVARPRDLDDLALILAGRLTTGKPTGWIAAATRLRASTEQDIS